MNFLDAEFVQEFIRMANDGWEQGWHERNGGNLSYRVKPEEAANWHKCTESCRRVFSGYGKR